MFSQIKEYKVITLIGRGGYGAVYKVKNINTNELFAMKIYLITESNKEDFISIENETKILSQLNHPNIIKLYNYFKVDNSFCLIMELCEGGDLSKLIEQKRKSGKYFNEIEIKKYLYEICKGLDYLHSHKIIHRDLKSLNIFITKNNNVKIGDFGVSKQLMNNNKYAYTFVGTPYYLSPEICSEKPYDEKSDMWSLGVVLYEMINLNKPFESNSQLGLVMKIIKDNPKEIANDIRQMFSGKLIGIIYSLLEKNPKRRWGIGQLMNCGLFEDEQGKKKGNNKDLGSIKKKEGIVANKKAGNSISYVKKISTGDITNKRVRTNPKNKQENKLV